MINYNPHQVNAKIDEDDNFWVVIGSGNLGTNEVTVEISSYMDVDADVEFYGHLQDNSHESPEL